MIYKLRGRGTGRGCAQHGPACCTSRRSRLALPAARQALECNSETRDAGQAWSPCIYCRKLFLSSRDKSKPLPQRSFFAFLGAIESPQFSFGVWMLAAQGGHAQSGDENYCPTHSLNTASPHRRGHRSAKLKRYGRKDPWRPSSYNLNLQLLPTAY